jgi:hypothetical protein
VNLLGIFGVGTASGFAAAGSIKISDVTDGLSSTIMVGEVYRGIPYWEVNGARGRLDFTGTRCDRWIVETGFCGADTSVPPNTALIVKDKQQCLSQYFPNWGSRGDNSPPEMSCPDMVDWVDNHNNGNQGRRPLSSLHPGGAQGTFGDGAVKFIGETVDLEIWRNTGTRFGSEAVVYTPQ